MSTLNTAITRNPVTEIATKISTELADVIGKTVANALTPYFRSNTVDKKKEEFRHTQTSIATTPKTVPTSKPTATKKANPSSTVSVEKSKVSTVYSELPQPKTQAPTTAKATTYTKSKRKTAVKNPFQVTINSEEILLKISQADSKIIDKAQKEIEYQLASAREGGFKQGKVSTKHFPSSLKNEIIQKVINIIEDCGGITSTKVNSEGFTQNYVLPAVIQVATGRNMSTIKSAEVKTNVSQLLNSIVPIVKKAERLRVAELAEKAKQAALRPELLNNTLDHKSIDFINSVIANYKAYSKEDVAYWLTKALINVHTDREIRDTSASNMTLFAKKLIADKRDTAHDFYVDNAQKLLNGSLEKTLANLRKNHPFRGNINDKGQYRKYKKQFGSIVLDSFINRQGIFFRFGRLGLLKRKCEGTYNKLVDLTRILIMKTEAEAKAQNA